MEKHTISMAIFNSYFDITRGLYQGISEYIPINSLSFPPFPGNLRSVAAHGIDAPTLAEALVGRMHRHGIGDGQELT